jgi:hypothetical protein
LRRQPPRPLAALVLIAAAMALVEVGPGSPSMDRALGIEAKGSRWALASLAAGVAGSALAIEIARRLHEENKAAEEQLQRSSRFVREREAAEREAVGATA